MQYLRRTTTTEVDRPPPARRSKKNAPGRLVQPNMDRDAKEEVFHHGCSGGPVPGRFPWVTLRSVTIDSPLTAAADLMDQGMRGNAGR